MFQRGVDPDNLVTVLYSNFLLTPEEKSKATQRTLTHSQKLDEIFTTLERRVSVKPDDFHTLVRVLREEPAIKAVGDRIQGEIFPMCLTSKLCMLFSVQISTVWNLVSYRNTLL